MNTYWDKRYQAEGKIWGDEPSRTAVSALELLRRDNVKKLLVPGGGYGRNTRLFSSSGFTVANVETSAKACQMARGFDPLTEVYNSSVLDMSFLPDKYDGVYCFNTLHLFRRAERLAFIRQCADRVRKNAPMFFTVFSEKEDTYGKGREVEKNTFESKPGRPAHYFTESDLREHFKDTKILETGIAEDPENHGGGPHVHILRYIFVRAGSK